MYDDPRHLKLYQVKVRLDEDTYQLFELLARMNGVQRAVFAREMLEEGLAEMAAEQGIPAEGHRLNVRR